MVLTYHSWMVLLSKYSEIGQVLRKFVSIAKFIYMKSGKVRFGVRYFRNISLFETDFLF